MTEGQGYSGPLLLIKYIIGSNIGAWTYLSCTLQAWGRRRPG